MKTYFRVMGMTLLFCAVIPMAIIFCQLFFYERFSAQQILIQASIQLCLFTAIFFCWKGFAKLLFSMLEDSPQPPKGRS